MRSPYKEKARTFCREASIENQLFKNQLFLDQNETGRVAQVHIDDVGHGSQAIAVQ